MEIKTKYGIGQRVFFVDTMNLRIRPAKIENIRIDVTKVLEVDVYTIFYFLSISEWARENHLYLTREEAQWQIDGRLQSPAMFIESSQGI